MTARDRMFLTFKNVDAISHSLLSLTNPKQTSANQPVSFQKQTLAQRLHAIASLSRSLMHGGNTERHTER
jgi:hypothetical protein